MEKRFASHTDEDIERKIQKTTPLNTQKMNCFAAETLRKYLIEKELDKDFEKYSEEQLAEVLGRFYIDARTTNGSMYKTSTLANIRHSLNCFLKSPPHNKKYDIISGEAFVDANEKLKTALKELKQSGQGFTNHFPKITDEDLTKLYMSIFLTPNTPSGLLNRVQMNIRLFFCRRANENFEQMTKTTFEVGCYQDGSRYVFKAEDELTKNHQANQKSLITGHMPVHKTNTDLCPVRLFEFYLSKLNPNCERLWQYPRESYQQENDCWYQNRPIGRDKLSTFLKVLSNKVPLSKVYTNHSIRVTGVSILGKKFNMAQIMSVSGHRSTSSLAVYQRVSDEEKKDMRAAISNKIYNREQSALPLCSTFPALPVPSCSTFPALPAAPQQQNQTALVPFSADKEMSSYRSVMSEIESINMDDLFANFDSLPDVPTGTQSTRVNRFQPGSGIFTNCQFSGVTFNFNIGKM